MTPTFALRPYQQDALIAVQNGWNEYRKQLVVLPTGTGKTILVAHLARDEVRRGNKVMMIAHREELLDQARDKFQRAVGLECGLEKAESHGYGLLQQDVTVASVQTLRGPRLKQWNPDDVQLIIVDEAHHILADTYLNMLEYFPDARVLGITATADRGDKRNLGKFFESIAYEYSMRKAIQDGFLCPIKALMVPLKIDLNEVRLVHGDFELESLESAILPCLEQAAQNIAMHAQDRKTLVFLPLVRTSKLFAQMLCNTGMKACHIDGASPDRAEILADFAANKYQVLTNASLLTEGYDCPDISCIVVLRPTQIRPLYQQMVGRGTRIAPGKKDLLILDFLWLTERHSLCKPASLVGKSEAEVKQIMDLIGTGEQVDLLQAEGTAQAQREEALRRSIAAQRNKKKRLVDPIEFALSIEDHELVEWEPTMAWHSQPASAKQLQILERFGIDVSVVRGKGHASMLLDRIFARRRNNLCTPKQAAFLARKGYIDAHKFTFEKASRLITELIGEFAGRR